MVLEKTLDSPLDCKLKAVNPKGNQSWIIIERTDAEAKVPILWPPDVKSWLIRKDPDAGKDWRQQEIGTTEDEMVGWHHQLNGHEFEQALGDGERQVGLACCSLWGSKESDWLSEWTATIPTIHGALTVDLYPKLHLTPLPFSRYGLHFLVTSRYSYSTFLYKRRPEWWLECVRKKASSDIIQSYNMVQIQKALTIQIPRDIAELWEIVPQPKSCIWMKSIEACNIRGTAAELVIINQDSTVEPHGMRSNNICKQID